ncbi:macrolide 2'-phosphotransferase [Arthrobacter agilis]|uniref:macrolide 2'-phosphotransferase n=1 Tax=Arthrobacter agilis TaxID=37921 RepID=UPI00278A217F|nr:macrolide 2'-phosphotransferase [Arthrobacter agilis]MDQ0735576.1 aminoglycoside phosphotransferase (APT) family kinase protein [Arthrobacter agilis]
MELAAIASAAVPGLAPTGVAGAPDDAADFDSALLVDDAGKQWRVRSPRHAEASMRLETELQALRAFTPAVKAELPFLIPHMAGSVRQGELSTFVYSHLTGTTRPLDVLTAGGQGMARELGRVLAAIHELPKDIVQRADLPSYEANEYRQRKLNELDQAATTGRIPAILLRRWEHALEDVTLWRFSPTVVHGDLHEDHLLISAGRVSAVTGWTDLCISDPAEDFAWLAAAEDTAFVDAVHEAYAGARTSAVDPHLPRRAALAAEFALAQWLVRGMALEDAVMIREAEGMLATLEADVEFIEREQHEAAERARHAHEERLEWGDDLGTDSYGSTGGHRPDDRVQTGGLSGRPENHAGTEENPGGPTAEATVPGLAVHSGQGPASHDAGTEVEDDRTGRTGSHAYDPDSTAGQRFHRLPDSAPAQGSRPAESSGPHRGDDDHGTASGSSLAYARLTAGRQRSMPTSSKVTLLRSSEQSAGSPDDVATSALPIVSFRG